MSKLKKNVINKQNVKRKNISFGLKCFIIVSSDHKLCR